MQIELTKEEAQELINMCDMATRAQGINVAQVAVPLALKLQEAIKNEQPRPPD